MVFDDIVSIVGFGHNDRYDNWFQYLKVSLYMFKLSIWKEHVVLLASFKTMLLLQKIELM